MLVWKKWQKYSEAYQWLQQNQRQDETVSIEPNLFLTISTPLTPQ